MKTKHATFLFLLGMAASACGPIDAGRTIPQVDQKRGYRNLTLDQPYSVLKSRANLNLVYDNQCTATKRYELTADSLLSISTTRFDKVELEFIRDSLYKTTLFKKYGDDLSQLKAIYRSEFGEPSEEKTVDFTGGQPWIYTEWIGTNNVIQILDKGYVQGFEIRYFSYGGQRRWADEEQACNERKVEKGRSEL